MKVFEMTYLDWNNSLLRRMAESKQEFAGSAGNRTTTDRFQTILDTFADSILDKPKVPLLTFDIIEINEDELNEEGQEKCAPPHRMMHLFRAEESYSESVLHLHKMAPDASFTDIKLALDRANQAWWQLEGARAPVARVSQPAKRRGCKFRSRVTVVELRKS